MFVVDTVANAIDYEVTWNPCDVTWPESMNVSVRGVDANGSGTTGWSVILTLNKGGNRCSDNPQPFQQSGVGIGAIADAPYQEMMFDGATTDEVFLKATNRKVGVPIEQTYGVDCMGQPSINAVNPTECHGDPVNTLTGAFVTSTNDLVLSGLGVPFSWTRTYTSADRTVGELGIGWTHSYAASLKVRPNNDVVFRAEDGQQIYYRKVGSNYVSPAGGRSELTAVTGGYEVLRPDLLTYGFDTTGKMVSITDRNGNDMTLCPGSSFLECPGSSFLEISAPELVIVLGSPCTVRAA
jgi:hypothetical protein